MQTIWPSRRQPAVSLTIRTDSRAYRDSTGKNRSFWEAIIPLVGPCVFFSLTTLWALASPTDILNRDPRCFTFLVGTVFSNICCRLIVAQMSSTRSEVLNWMIYPVASVVAVALTLPASIGAELPLLYAITAFATLMHVHYGVCVVSNNSVATPSNVVLIIKKKLKKKTIGSAHRSVSSADTSMSGASS